MNIQRSFVTDGLERAECKALSFWINNKTRKELGLEYQMFDSVEACKFIDDVAAGKETWDQSCTAEQQTWKLIKAESTLHNKETRIANGVDVVKQRFRKLQKLNELRKTASRLQSEVDDCTDIIGNGTAIEVIDAAQQAKRAQEHYAKSTRICGRLSAMNEHLKYFDGGSFYLLAGGSGTGKTNLAFQTFGDQNVLYIGLDMSMHQTVKRIYEIGAYAIIPPSLSFQNKRSMVENSWNSAREYAGRIAEHLMPNFRTIDIAALTVEQLKFIISEEISKGFKPKAVIVDYIDKLDSEQKFKSEFERQKHVGRILKEIAKTLDVGILGLVQYNGSWEPYKVGQSNWIQGSKDLIATSDGCICIWRSKIKNEYSGQDMPDPGHIWISNSLKSRDTGLLEDMRIDCSGLYLFDHNGQEDF